MIGVSLKGRKFGRICPARKLRVHRLSREVRKVGPRGFSGERKERPPFWSNEICQPFQLGSARSFLFQISIRIINGSSGSI